MFLWLVCLEEKDAVLPLPPFLAQLPTHVRHLKIH